MDLFKAMDIRASGLSAQRDRMNVISSNISNIHTTQTPEGEPCKKKSSVLEAQPAKNSFEQMVQDCLSEQVKAVKVVGTRESTKPPIKISKTSFKDLLKESIEEADQVQKETGKAVESLAVGKGEDIHETMIALEKADVSFKMMMEVRNKIVKAYEKVMRMQV